MLHTFFLAILWLSPLLLTWIAAAGATLFAAWSQTQPRPLPPRRIAAVAAGLWFAHLGYLLAPVLWNVGLSVVALWLMLPAVAATLWFSRSPRCPWRELSPECMHAVRVGGALIYVLPLLVILLTSPAPISEVPLTSRSTLAGILRAAGWTLGVFALFGGAAGVTFALVQMQVEAPRPGLRSDIAAVAARQTLLRRTMLGVLALSVFCSFVALMALSSGRTWLGAGFALLPLLAAFATLSYRAAREA